MGILERIRGQKVFDNINVKSLHHPQPTFVVAASATTDIMTVNFQANAQFQTDSAGNRISAAYPFYIATDTAGVILAAGTVVTGSSQGDTSIGGAVIHETTLNDFRKGTIVTNTTGEVQVALTNTGTDTAYMVVVLPNGRLSVSGAIVWT